MTSVQVPTLVVVPTVSLHTGMPDMFTFSCRGNVANTWTPHSQALDCPPYAGLHLRTTDVVNPLWMHSTSSAPVVDTPVQCLGKAPPIDLFAGENSEIR